LLDHDNGDKRAIFVHDIHADSDTQSPTPSIVEQYTEFDVHQIIENFFHLIMDMSSGTVITTYTN
jgi:hypothetical protein